MACGLCHQVLEPSFRVEFVHVNRWFLTCVNQPQFKSVLGEVTICEKMAQFDGRELVNSKVELHPSHLSIPPRSLLLSLSLSLSLSQLRSTTNSSPRRRRRRSLRKINNKGRRNLIQRHPRRRRKQKINQTPLRRMSRRTRHQNLRSLLIPMLACHQGRCLLPWQQDNPS